MKREERKYTYFKNTYNLEDDSTTWKVPKVTARVTFVSNSLFLLLLSEGRYFQEVATSR